MTSALKQAERASAKAIAKFMITADSTIQTCSHLLARLLLRLCCACLQDISAKGPIIGKSQIAYALIHKHPRELQRRGFGSRCTWGKAIAKMQQIGKAVATGYSNTPETLRVRLRSVRDYATRRAVSQVAPRASTPWWNGAGGPGGLATTSGNGYQARWGGSVASLVVRPDVG